MILALTGSVNRTPLRLLTLVPKLDNLVLYRLATLGRPCEMQTRRMGFATAFRQMWTCLLHRREAGYAMDVDYRPIGRKHRVVAVLETVDGRPAREISIRKYIRMLKKYRKRNDPLALTLKPLKNILREYLKSNPEYAVYLRLQDTSERGIVQITDGKFVLKQLTLEELRGHLAENASFVAVTSYRQIARQTENFKAFGSTLSPYEAPAPQIKKDMETAILAERPTGLRAWLNAHTLVLGAGAAALLMASITWAVLATRAPTVQAPAANFADPASVELMIQRCEAATRGYMTQIVEDPQGVRDAMRGTRRFLEEVEKQTLTASQVKRIDAIRYRLDKLEDAAEGVQAQ